MNAYRIIISIAFLFNFLAAPASGQNRVIVKKFDWKIYSTEHFDIYFYKDSEGWLKYAAGSLERAYSKISADLNPSLNKRIPFFLYASSNDMQQTSVANISDGTGGITEPLKDRFMIWGDGSKEWLENLIIHEFTHEVQFSVLVDGFWKSARILKTYIYPLWMMEGLAEYETGRRDAAMEQMYVRDAAINKGLLKLLYMNHFGHLKPHQMTLAYKQSAQAIRFLADQYGKEKLPRMLELYKSRYDINSVLRELIGSDIFDFDRRFREYTELKYSIQVNDENLVEPSRYGIKLTKQKDDIPEFNTSPQVDASSEFLAYFSTKDGHPASLCVRNIKTGKEKTIKADSLGIENIPSGRFTKTLKSLSMSADGKWLVFSGQKNHREALHVYNIQTGKHYRIRAPELMEMRQPSFSADASKIVFVGMKEGFNDIYEIDFKPEFFKRDASLSDLRRLTKNNDDESSPAYSPDGRFVAYSCEVEKGGVFERDICKVDMKGVVSREVELKGGQYDPVFSPDGKRLAFVSDSDDIFEIYEKNLETGKLFRMTRTRGGNFSPAYSGDGSHVYFSSFLRGNMNIYEADARNFLYEEIGFKKEFAAADFSDDEVSAGVSSEAVASSVSSDDIKKEAYKDVEFKLSTDLFFPAFMFSSPGGLFWMNYWQMSDMLGYNTLVMFLNYNSGSDYISYQLGYTYTKFRPQFFAQISGVALDGISDSLNLEYDKRYSQQIAGVSYPFDRYNSLSLAGIRKNDKKMYQAAGADVVSKTRALQASFTRNTVRGLYLIANSGNRLELSHIKADEVLGGNEKYDVFIIENLKYFPLSKRSAFVTRMLAGSSSGRDKGVFDFGGLGGVRGFRRSSSLNEAPKVVMGNFELRTPIIDDLNYYMWYMLPDFYFKSVYLKVFADSAYGFENNSEINDFGIGKLKTSFGFGLNIHTFVLQQFQMVLSFDYAFRASDGGRIFYFYLGPIF